MKLFEKIFNHFQLLTVFAKKLGVRCRPATLFKKKLRQLFVS